MTAITIEQIKALRQASGAGIMDCRRALEACRGDADQAQEQLRQQGLETALARANRQASQGVIELYNHANGRAGVMVEINTETDFAGRSEALRAFAHEIALQIAAAAPLYVSEDEIPPEVLSEKTQESEAKARREGKPEAVIPRIAAGQLKKFKDETVLLNQAYIRDDALTVGKLLNQTIASVGENIVIRRFARYELGESETA